MFCVSINVMSRLWTDMLICAERPGPAWAFSLYFADYEITYSPGEEGRMLEGKMQAGEL